MEAAEGLRDGFSVGVMVDDWKNKDGVMSNLDEMNVYIAPTTYWTEEDELPEGVNVGDVKVEEHAEQQLQAKADDLFE